MNPSKEILEGEVINEDDGLILRDINNDLVSDTLVGLLEEIKRKQRLKTDWWIETQLNILFDQFYND